MTTVERLRALYEDHRKSVAGLESGAASSEGWMERHCQMRDHEFDLETAMHAALPHLLAVVEAAEVAAKQGHVDTCAVRLLSSAGLTIPGCTCGLAALRTALHHLNAGKKEE